MGALRAAGHAGGTIDPVTAVAGPSNRLAGLRVGVYGSGGAPWHHLALVAVHGGAPIVVRAEDISARILDDLDLLVFPGGGALAMGGLLAPLGDEGASAVRDWVAGGGTYVGSCAGSVLPVALTGAADELLPAARCLRLVDVPLANTGDTNLGGLSSPGVGAIVVRIDPDHPFTSGVPERLELVHYNGPLFDISGAGPAVRAFAWPIGTTERFTLAERFLETPDEPYEGRTTMAESISRGAATAVESAFGDGRVVLFGSHPEFGLGPLGLGWGEGVELLLRALAARDGRRSPDSAPVRGAVAAEFPDSSPAELAARAIRELLQVSERFEALAGRDAGKWLEPGYAAAFHGVSAREAWPVELKAAAEACAVAARVLAELAPALDLEADRAWLDDRPRPAQDFGAMGLVQLLSFMQGQLGEAERLIEEQPQRPDHAYDLFDAHPYHLAMGSYLSASGLAAAALLIVTVLAAKTRKVNAALAGALWQHVAPP